MCCWGVGQAILTLRASSSGWWISTQIWSTGILQGFRPPTPAASSQDQHIMGALWMSMDHMEGVEVARPLERIGSGFESWLGHLVAVYDYGKMIALSLNLPSLKWRHQCHPVQL